MEAEVKAEKNKVDNLIKAKQADNEALLASIDEKNKQLEAAKIAQQQAQAEFEALSKKQAEDEEIVITTLDEGGAKPGPKQPEPPKPKELTEPAKAVLAKLEIASSSSKFNKFEKNILDDGGFNYTTVGKIASFEGKVNNDGSGSVKVKPDIWDNDIKNGNQAAIELARHLVEDLDFAEVT